MVAQMLFVVETGGFARKHTAGIVPLFALCDYEARAGTSSALENCPQFHKSAPMGLPLSWLLTFNSSLQLKQGDARLAQAAILHGGHLAATAQ